MKHLKLIATILLVNLIMLSCNPGIKQTAESQISIESGRKLIAKTYNSGFKLAHVSFNSISSASDGKIYYVLSSESIDEGAQMYSFDPKTDKIQHLADLTEVCGEKGLKTIPQGKSHVRFVEVNKKLYFASHLGYYNVVGKVENVGITPPGYKPYPGGHLLSYDLANGHFEDMGIPVPHEGIITMNMDTTRGMIYGLTWPTGNFFRFDINDKKTKNFGAITGEGEKGKGSAFRALCRSFAVNPEDGTVYFTISEGTILHYHFGEDKVEPVKGENLVKDYFGQYDPNSPGHMGYNWRQVVWYPAGKVIYGVHGNSGYLFRFDPGIPRVEVLDRITSEPSQISGMFDKFYYGYLGFILGPDGHTLYYLTGGPVYIDGKRAEKTQENLHLITYHIPDGKYQDHGPIFFADGQCPLYVQSIAIGSDNTVYALAQIAGNEQTRTDLISIVTKP